MPPVVHNNSGNTGPTCNRCGRKGHVVKECLVTKDIICHNCGKKGHMKRICQKKSVKTKLDQPGSARQKSETVRQAGRNQTPDRQKVSQTCIKYTLVGVLECVVHLQSQSR